MNYWNKIYIIWEISLEYIVNMLKEITLSILNSIIQTISLIIENFNFAWLFLIIFFILRHELTLLLLSITKFSYRDASVDIDIKTSRKTMEYLNGKLEKKYGNEYNEIRLPISGNVGFGAGNLGPDESIEDRGTISLYADALLKQAYERDGSIDTIISMYNIFIDSYLNQDKDHQDIDLNEVKDKQSNEEISLVNNIENIYRKTLFNKDIKYLWRFEDILMYRKMILMAMKISYKDSVNN